MYIQCLCYMFQPRRVIFRQHIFLRSLLHYVLGQIVLLRHIVLVIINFNDVGCLSSFFFFFGLRPFVCPIWCAVLLVVFIYCCSVFLATGC
jgi:hypothetical protein